MSLRIYGNRALKTLPGLETRPTPAMVRQAIFNIWQGAIPGCRWLDLCAGTGAMGAEALCRGAALAVGIEQSGKACAVIQQNWQMVAQPEQRFQVLRGDLRRQLAHLSGQQFDRIYFDPPYDSDLYAPALQAVSELALLSDLGELAAEHRLERQMPEVAGLSLLRQKSYGGTAVAFYARASD